MDVGVSSDDLSKKGADSYVEARGRTRIVLRTAWRPFRFEATAAKLKDLQQNLEREISLQSLKNSQQISRTACVADTTYVSVGVVILLKDLLLISFRTI